MTAGPAVLLLVLMYKRVSEALQCRLVVQLAVTKSCSITVPASWRGVLSHKLSCDASGPQVGTSEPDIRNPTLLHPTFSAGKAGNTASAAQIYSALSSQSHAQASARKQQCFPQAAAWSSPWSTPHWNATSQSQLSRKCLASAGISWASRVVSGSHQGNL